jgi:hypothetical protein
MNFLNDVGMWQWILIGLGAVTFACSFFVIGAETYSPSLPSVEGQPETAVAVKTTTMRSARTVVERPNEKRFGKGSFTKTVRTACADIHTSTKRMLSGMRSVPPAGER